MKIIILILSLILTIGCARVTYKDGELNYSRWGDQRLEGFRLEKAVDGTIRVEFDKQQGGEALIEALEAIKALAGKLP